MHMRYFILAMAALVFPTVHRADSAPAYRIVNLGSLDGGFTVATGVNDYNLVTGHSVASSGDTHAYLFDNGMRDLWRPDDGLSRGAAINNFGQVVGDASFEQHNLSITAYIVHNGTITNLGTLGGPSSQAAAINNHGIVVGGSLHDPLPNDIRTFAGQYEIDLRPHAFVYENGVMRDLHVEAGLNGGSSWATDINDNSQIVGMIENRGFVYTNGRTTELFLDGARSVHPLAINNVGVVALYVDDVDGKATGYLYNQGNSIPIGSLGGGESVAYDINDHGVAVGSSTTPEIRPFIWSPVTMNASTDSPTSNAGGISDINGLVPQDLVYVPGSPNLGSPVWHAFIYKNGELADLNSLIPQDSGWELTHANGINAAGVIVGSGTFDGQTWGYMLIPVPEPATLVLAALAIAVVSTGRRRRTGILAGIR
jgi:probable HAF family extracellular repeat protein